MNFNFPFHIWVAILPIDELHHFSRWLKHVKTTNQLGFPWSMPAPWLSTRKRVNLIVPDTASNFEAAKRDVADPFLVAILMVYYTAGILMVIIRIMK